MSRASHRESPNKENGRRIEREGMRMEGKESRGKIAEDWVTRWKR